MKNLAFVVAALSAVAVSACGGGTRTTPQSQTSTTSGGCTSSIDCPSGQTCDAGSCKANAGGSACTTAMDCPEDQYCQAGNCVGGSGGDSDNTGTSCTSNSDCSGQKCSSFGVCVACTVDSDCSSGQTCGASFTCSSSTTTCASDTDCSNGTHCKTATDKCVQCVTDADCASRSALRAASAKVCRNDLCTDPNASCTNNNDCNGYVCDATTSACVACTSSGDCATGQTCNTSTGICSSGGTTACSSSADCGGQACANGTCQRCTSDSQCISGSTSGICNATTGACGTPECTTASQCPAGEACYTPGHCGPCVSDSECRTGEMCRIVAPDTTGWCVSSGGTGGGTCTTNAQCSTDLVCVSGKCGSCTASTQCNSGETCSWNGRCTGGTGSGSCTADTDCPYGYSCSSGSCAINTSGTGTGAFGSTCTNYQQCAPGLTCAGLSSDTSICTTTCIGDGLGGNDDCPSGYSCVDWESTTLDGLKICLSATQLGSDALGYPFTTAPGGACDGSNPYTNTCQTSFCLGAGDTCSRFCNADTDCDSTEVCYAWPDTTYGYVHECYPSDTTDYLDTNEACDDNSQCDSGICLGQCSDGSPCGSSSECASGDTCSGACVSHCRTVNDCTSDSSCNFWPMYITDTSYSGWTPVCSGRIYNGTGALGSACTADSDCDSEWCMYGICTTPCGTSDDCTGGLAGKFCTPVNFYDGSTPVYSGSFCF